MRRGSLLFAACFLLACGEFAKGDDANLPPGEDVTLPAFPSQLPVGSKPGTFHFSEPVLVKFKQQQEFPVGLVIRDYAHKEVFCYRIKGPKISILSCDLAPGSYQQSYEMIGQAKNDYLDWHDNRSSIFINPEGQCSYGYTSQPLRSDAYTGRYPYDAVFRRRIETLGPRDKAVVSAKSIHFRWKPTPGVDDYTISAWPIEDLDHPDSSFSAERMTKYVRGCDVTIQSGLAPDQWDLTPGECYVWVVENGNDEDEIAKHVAQSLSATFQVAGKLARVGNWPPQNFMRDEAIEPRMKMRLLQPYITSDGGDGFSTVNVLGIGDGSPLLKAGLGLDTRIESLNGVKTSTLAEFHKALLAIPPGQTVKLGIVVPDIKRQTLTTLYYSISIP